MNIQKITQTSHVHTLVICTQIQKQEVSGTPAAPQNQKGPLLPATVTTLLTSNATDLLGLYLLFVKMESYNECNVPGPPPPFLFLTRL